jgi:hypothetical protein
MSDEGGHIYEYNMYETYRLNAKNAKYDLMILYILEKL